MGSPLPTRSRPVRRRSARWPQAATFVSVPADIRGSPPPRRRRRAALPRWWCRPIAAWKQRSPAWAPCPRPSHPVPRYRRRRRQPRTGVCPRARPARPRKAHPPPAPPGEPGLPASNASCRCRDIRGRAVNMDIAPTGWPRPAAPMAGTSSPERCHHPLPDAEFHRRRLRADARPCHAAVEPRHRRPPKLDEDELAGGVLGVAHCTSAC